MEGASEGCCLAVVGETAGEEGREKWDGEVDNAVLSRADDTCDVLVAFQCPITGVVFLERHRSSWRILGW